MTAKREHLAGLELALSTLKIEGYMTGAGCRDHIQALIEEAQSAPEPVQGDDFCDGHCTWLEHQPGCPRHGAVQAEAVDDYAAFESFMEIHGAVNEPRKLQYMLWKQGRPAAAKPDAELVELLRGLVDIVGRKKRGRPGSPNHSHTIPGIWDSDNGDLAGKPCAECALYDLAVARIATLLP